MQRAAAKKGAPVTEELPRGAIQAEEDAKWVMPSRRIAAPSQSFEAGPSRLGGRIQVTWESSYMPFIGSSAQYSSESARDINSDDDDEDMDRADGPSHSFAGGGRMQFGYGQAAEASGSGEQQGQNGGEDEGMSDDGEEQKERPPSAVRKEKKQAAAPTDTSVCPNKIHTRACCGAELSDTITSEAGDEAPYNICWLRSTIELY